MEVSATQLRVYVSVQGVKYVCARVTHSKCSIAKLEPIRNLVSLYDYLIMHKSLFEYNVKHHGAITMAGSQRMPSSIATKPIPLTPFHRSNRAFHSKSVNSRSRAYVEPNALGDSCKARNRTSLKIAILSKVICSIRTIFPLYSNVSRQRDAFETISTKHSKSHSNGRQTKSA